MHGIMDVQPNFTFKVLLEYYGNRSYQIRRKETVAHVLTQLSGMVSTSLNISDVLGKYAA